MSRLISVSRRRRSAGFTIVELLAAIAIVGILLAVLLPAVQSVREAARQTECRSHLHQFGVAVNAFEAVHARLPSCAGPKHQTGDSVHPYSAHFQLLPYFEQKAVYETIDFAKSPPRFTDPRRLAAAIRQSFGVFACPSDPVEGGNNYRVSFGALGSFCVSNSECPEGGAFNRLGGTALAEVRDGLSHSAAASERYKSDDDTSSFSALDLWYSGRAALPGYPSREEMIDIARRAEETPAHFQPRVGRQWLYGDFAATWYNHLLEPNSEVLDCSMDAVKVSIPVDENEPFRTDTVTGVHSARSHHPGTVHVLMLDGAVDLASNTIDLGVWREIGSIAPTAADRRASRGE
jgi:prepilin-type N-terminal cleavage/methylation domain-containing protein